MTPPNNQLPYFKPQRLSHLTPSKFTALRGCAWREVLQSSVGYDLLQAHPKAWLGSIIHNMVEAITKNQIADAVSFEAAWQNLVLEKENVLRQIGWGHWLPLSQHIEGFALKKFKTKRFFENHLAQKSNFQITNVAASSLKMEVEKLLQTPDGWLKGKADAIVTRAQGVEIIDYKTGGTHDANGELKTVYREQLLLYAWLFAQNNGGVYPSALSILDLQLNRYPVSFTPSDCEELAFEAKSLFLTINQAVDYQWFEQLTKPSAEQCGFCSMRPICQFKSLDFSEIVGDTEGGIMAIVPAENGIILLDNGKRFTNCRRICYLLFLKIKDGICIWQI
jgi:RecB family exonuclease